MLRNITRRVLAVVLFVVGCGLTPAQSDNSWQKLTPNPSSRYIPRDATASGTLENQPHPQSRAFSGIYPGGNRIFYFGGGHNGHPGNDVEIYEIDNNVWVQSYNPEVCPLSGAPCSTLYGGNGVDEITPGGHPYTEHAYQMLRWNPTTNKLFGAITPGTWEFDPQTKDWEVLAGTHHNPPTFSPCANTATRHLLAYDEGIQAFQTILSSGGCDTQGVYEWKNDQWTYKGNPNPSNSWGFLYSAYNPDQGVHYVKCLESCGEWGNGFWIYNAATTTFTPMQGVPSGAGAVLDFDYDTENNVLVGLRYSPFEVWVYNPGANSWSKQPGTSPTPPTGIGAQSTTSHNPVFVYSQEQNLFYYQHTDNLGGGQTGGSLTEMWSYRYRNSGSTGDTSPPSTPQNLNATALGSDRVDLDWNAASDNQSGVSHYKLYRDGGFVAQIGTTSFSNTGLAAETTYSYSVAAVNGEGIEGAQSSAAQATTGSSGGGNEPGCGNDTVDSGETCDGSDLDGNTCATIGQGFTGGSLACNNSCSGWNTSGCQSGGSSDADADFLGRCSDSDVVRCYNFDDPVDAAPHIRRPGTGNGEAWEARCQNGVCSRIVSDQTASGGGALRFEVPSQSGGDTSGSFDINFSDDMSVQFGEGDEFYVQWRQRFSPEFINHVYDLSAGQGGWKTVIVGEGDRPGHQASSCTQLETVINNGNQQGFPQMYHSCGGKDGRYFGFHYYADQVSPGHQNPLLQNNRTQAESCWWDNNQPNPNNCFKWHADEWLTFQMHFKIGTWYANTGGGGNYPDVCVNDPTNYVCDSTMRLWIAREGQPADLVMDWTDAWDYANTDWRCGSGNPWVTNEVSCSADGNNDAPDPGKCSSGQTCRQAAKFGKVWFTPFHTGKDPGEVHPSAFTWYDELIVSRSRIPDPVAGTNGGGGDPPTEPPAAPQGVRVN